MSRSERTKRHSPLLPTSARGSAAAVVRPNSNVALPLSVPTVATSRAQLSPLFVASASSVDELSEGNKKALLSIEKEIEKANRQKEKYLEKVSKFDDITSTLEKKKNDYLDGLALGKVRLRRQSAQVRFRALQRGGELQELRPSLGRTLGQRGGALKLRSLVEELARRLLQPRVHCREALQHRRHVGRRLVVQQLGQRVHDPTVLGEVAEGGRAARFAHGGAWRFGCASGSLPASRRVEWCGRCSKLRR